MSSDIKRIANPKYMTMEEIKQQYWENWLLVSNTDGEDWISGGIVQYISDKSKNLYEKMRELDKESEKYGSTMVFYIGDKGNMLGGLII